MNSMTLDQVIAQLTKIKQSGRIVGERKVVVTTDGACEEFSILGIDQDTWAEEARPAEPVVTIWVTKIPL